VILISSFFYFPVVTEDEFANQGALNADGDIEDSMNHEAGRSILNLPMRDFDVQLTYVAYTRMFSLTDNEEDEDDEEEEEEQGTVFQETDFKLDEFLQRCDMNRTITRGVRSHR